MAGKVSPLVDRLRPQSKSHGKPPGRERERVSEKRLAAKWIPGAGAALAGTGGWASRSAPRRPWMLGLRGEGRAGGAGHTPRTRAGHRRAAPPRSFPSPDSLGAARCMSLSGRRLRRLCTRVPRRGGSSGLQTRGWWGAPGL